MDETEVIYGTIGTVPMGEYDPDIKYELLNLVSYDGSSYVVHTDPPVGTLPTDLNYWQVSAQGTGKATADSVGTVKPDGVTTAVNTDGALSVKTATNTTRGAVKGSRSINVSEDGGIYIPTEFTQATELVNLLAGEVLDVMLGKISKAIAVTMGLDQNALLKNMLTNIDANDQTKIPTAAFIHTLYERIGMGEDLDIGANLTAVLKALNSNLALLSNKFVIVRVAGSTDQYGQITCMMGDACIISILNLNMLGSYQSNTIKIVNISGAPVLHANKTVSIDVLFYVP